MKKTGFLLLLLPVAQSWGQSATADIAVVGQALPPWQQGYLDLHHINTGRGNAAFYILPDGTTVLFDAGELDPTNPRTTSKRNTPIRPNSTRKPYEWIAAYIRQVAPLKEKTVIDYGIISHFHDDHFGSWYPGAPWSRDSAFALTGITGVADLLPLHTLLTRDYHYPVNPQKLLQGLDPGDHYVKTWANYLAFLGDRQRAGLVNDFLRAGSASQLRLLHHPAAYPGFYVQNVKSNGWIWSGRKDSSVEQHFPAIDTADRST